MRNRDRLDLIKSCRDGVAACEDVLTRFPGDSVYTRSLREWQRRLAKALAIPEADQRFARKSKPATRAAPLTKPLDT